MDTRRLEIFCRVIELKSFTRAAQALQLSQPTVSEHVRALEATLDERLVDRLGREALPTPAGRIFYQYARNIIRQCEEAVQALTQFKGTLSGHLVLGASTIPGTYLLPKLIGAFRSTHPAILITLRIDDTAGVVNGVLEEALEAGIIGSAWTDRRLLVEELFTDELLLVVPPEHPWAKQGAVDLDDLEGEPFILREPGSGTRMVMTRLLEDRGFNTSRLFVVAEMGSTEGVRQGIRARIGVSILSRHAVEEDIQHGMLASVEVRGVKFLRPLYFLQRKNRRMSPLCMAFADFLRRAAGVSKQSAEGLA
ncbi:MAG: LysR family transcriptional regulator [Desulfomonile tiedjei]|nr:LysR family transcriptional regulator [Desulfomonile tiedjei]